MLMGSIVKITGDSINIKGNNGEFYCAKALHVENFKDLNPNDMVRFVELKQEDMWWARDVRKKQESPEITQEDDVGTVTLVLNLYIIMKSLKTGVLYQAKKNYVTDWGKLKVADLVFFIPTPKKVNKIAGKVTKVEENEKTSIEYTKHPPKISDLQKHDLAKIEICRKIVKDVGKHETFEDAVHLILTCISEKIKDLNTYQYNRRKQAGRADGFLFTPTLAVLWDATLNELFESEKKEQIENYINQISKGYIKISTSSSDEQKIHFNSQQKQVWIITRNKTKTMKNTIHTINNADIIVKEVLINDLLDFLSSIYEGKIKPTSEMLNKF